MPMSFKSAFDDSLRIERSHLAFSAPGLEPSQVDLIEVHQLFDQGIVLMYRSCDSISATSQSKLFFDHEVAAV